MKENEQVVIMVGIEAVGLGDVERSEVGVIEVRVVSGREGFWIEKLFNGNSRETPEGKQ